MGARRMMLIITVVALAILLPAAPAHAGGAHWTFEGHDPNEESVLVSGEKVHASGGLSLRYVVPGMRRGGAWAGPEQGPFFGYIVARKGSDWGPYPPPLPDDAMLVGQVSFTATDDPDVMTYSLDFVMPELAPGYYSLLHCNDPCTRQIGDMLTTPITVVEDRGQTFIMGVVNEIDRSLLGIHARVGHRVKVLQRDAGGMQSDVTSLEATIVSLEDRVATLERAASESRREQTPARSWPPWVTGAILLAGGLVLIWLLVGRPRPFFSSRSPSGVGLEEKKAG